jgi:hypothetical protein
LYIYDAAHIISTKIAKKHFYIKKDHGEVLFFQNIMYHWVCYECVKMLYVFGIQPTIRSDISTWSPELDFLFEYFSNMNANDEEQKKEATNILDILLNSTAHSSYFNKLPFGKKTKLVHIDKPILYLVVLTWLRQLQQHFFNQNETDNKRDWHKKFGRYCATNTTNKNKFLGYIHMSKAKSITPTPVKSFDCFIPSKSKNCITSLLQWAAQILSQDISFLSETADDDMKERLRLAEKPPIFELSQEDLTKKTSHNEEEEEEEEEEESNISTAAKKDKVSEITELPPNTKFKAIATALAVAAEKKKLNKRKHDDLEHGTNCLLSLINETNKTTYNNLDEFLQNGDGNENGDGKRDGGGT